MWQQADQQPDASPLVRAFRAVETQEDLDSAVTQLVTDCSSINKVRPPSVTNRPRKRPCIANLPPQAVQRFYSRNRKRSFEQITGHKDPSLDIPINTLGDALSASMGTNHTHSAQELLVRGEASEDITGRPVLPAEVLARLAKAANSAPSPLDRLTYQHLKRFDAEGKVLAALYTACLRTGLTPSAWRSYVTILLYKRPREPTPEEAANPKNWRPIALLPTLSKVLTGILADRLAEWASNVAAISASQKGCYKGEGCFEHIHILSTIRDFASPSKPAHLGFLDLADAFTSVPHGLILDTLRARGISEACINILQSLYTGTETTVANALGERAAVQIRSGVRQGCPASPILFALAIEPLLRTPFAEGTGFRVEQEEVHILAYADDLVVVASSQQALQHKLDQLTARAGKLGLRFNPAKCATLAWGSQRLPASSSVDGVPIKTIDGADFYKYLGTPVGMSGWLPDHAVLSTFCAELEAVRTSALRPWQKLDAIRTFIFTKLGYHLRTSSLPVQHLDRKKGGLDRWASRAVKRILHLPATASEAYLHTPTHLGGVGLPSARAEQAILQVAHFLRMATCPDGVVRALTFSALRKVIEQRCLVGAPSLESMASFLNGELPTIQQGRGSTTISPVLQSLKYLKKTIGARIVVDGESLAVSLPCDDGEERRIGVEDRANVIQALHDAMGLAFFHQWRGQANQGKAAPLYAAAPEALAAFDRYSGMRFCDWRFLHRARLNLIPTNAVKAAYYPEAAASCRICGAEQETLSHVLGRCWHHSPNINRRHNAVQDAVVAALPSSEGQEVLVNRTPTAFTTSERVDLQVINRANHTVKLIDFKCPFESGSEAFTAARQRNEEKYRELADRYGRLGFDVTLDTICVGALGTWDPQNSRPLKTLGIPRSRVKALQNTCCRAVLHLSRNIWVEHVTGTSQTY